MNENTTPVDASRDHAPPNPERRVSIWSVPVDFGPWFYLLLVTHTAPLVFLLWWTDLTPKTNDNIANIIVNVTSGAAPLIFVAAVSTIIELEVLVVLREWYRDRAARKERERAEERQKEDREAHQRGYKEGFEAGRKAEREAKAAASSGSSDKTARINSISSAQQHPYPTQSLNQDPSAGCNTHPRTL